MNVASAAHTLIHSSLRRLSLHFGCVGERISGLAAAGTGGVLLLDSFGEGFGVGCLVGIEAQSGSLICVAAAIAPLT